MKKRLLAMIMAFVMAMSLLPMSALAATGSYIGYDKDGQPITDPETPVTAVKTAEGGKLVMEKSIQSTENPNEYVITLGVTTTEDLTKIPLSQDAAVVLLIDSSTSMDFCEKCGGEDWHANDCDYYNKWYNKIKNNQTRLFSAKKAACDFVDSFGNDSAGGKRMIAVVKFNYNADIVCTWTDANDAANGEANRDSIKTAINSIQTGSWTNPDAALQLAYNLYGNTAVKDIASRFTILLTDGQPNAKKDAAGNESSVPGNGYTDSSEEERIPLSEAATSAAATATSLKKDKKVTLYTLAFATADATCYTEEKEEQCNIQGWHRHEDAKDDEGKKGRLIDGVFSEHNLFDYPTHYKKDGCTRGWFNGEHRLGTEKKTITVGEWLNSIASPNCYKNATEGEQVSIAFAQISATIRKLMQAWQVVDPMGDYINFEGLTAENSNVTLQTDPSDSTKVTGFTWNLWDETPTKNAVPPSEGAVETYTYTYTLSYKISLDTEADGFSATNPDGSDKYYPTNQATYVTYTLNALNADGTLNTNAKIDKDYFNIPTVKAAAPKEVVVPGSDSDSESGKLEVIKAYDGTWPDAGFKFKLTAKDNAPMPEGSKDGVSEITITKPESGTEGKSAFGGISYDTADTYTYTVEEVIPEGATAANGYTVNGVTYDTTKYTVTIKITDNQTGGLEYEVTYTSDKNADFSYTTKDGMTFANRYSTGTVVVPGGDSDSEEGKLEVIKAYNGTWPDVGFKFKLTAKDNAPMPEGSKDGVSEITITKPESGTEGKSAFGGIAYDTADTYTYTVEEVIPEGATAANGYTVNGVTYDVTKYTVTVTVIDNQTGGLEYGVTYTSDKDANFSYATKDGMKFTNTYTAPSTPSGGGNHKPPVLNKEDHYAYIVGYPDGTVKPQGNITRAEVATIFFRMLTDDSRNEFWSQTNSYSDVSEGQWFNNAISTLANAGILSGYPDGTFRPNAPITRAEFTKIAASFFERVEYTIDNPFNDVDDDDWFYKFVMAAYEGGLITGYPEGDFRPNANISRAESVTIVNRTLERAPDADHFLKDMIVWPDNAENAWYYEAVQEATNSHEYVVKGTGTNKYEEWTKILEVRDWPALEKEWSNANSATGGEVVK